MTAGSGATAGAGVAPAPGEHTAITLRGVGKIYPGRGGPDVTALSGIELSIRRGEFVTLFGPSGCGKSTLLRILAGLESLSTGTVDLFGQTPRQASADKNIAWVPQSSALLPWLTVRQNAVLSTRLNRAADRRPHPSRQVGDADAILAAMGLADRADALPSQLSGGMRQRASIARGFVQGAPVMLMDEPFAALDELTRETLRQQLLEVWDGRSPRKTVVFVTHSAEEAALLSDRVVVMATKPGRIHEVVEVAVPRSQRVADNPEFAETVRTITRTLREGWSGE